MIVGEDIPYRRFACNSLEHFLREEPSMVVTQNAGQVFVDAVPTSKSKHISGLVNKQKSSKKPKRITSRAPARYPQHRNIQNWKPAASGKRWGPPVQGSPRPAAVSHRQTVIRGADNNMNRASSSTISSRLTAPYPNAAGPNAASPNSSSAVPRSSRSCGPPQRPSNASGAIPKAASPNATLPKTSSPNGASPKVASPNAAMPKTPSPKVESPNSANPGQWSFNSALKNGFSGGLASTNGRIGHQLKPAASSADASDTLERSRAVKHAALAGTAASMADIRFTVNNPRPWFGIQPTQQLYRPILQPPMPTADRPRMRSHTTYAPSPLAPHFQMSYPAPDLDVSRISDGSSPQRARLPSSDSSSGTPPSPGPAAATVPPPPPSAPATRSHRAGLPPPANIQSPLQSPDRATYGNFNYHEACRPVSLFRTPSLDGDDLNVPELVALRAATLAHGLPTPKVKVVPRPGKKPTSKCLYDCSIKVEQHRTFQSYPRDCFTAEAAVAEAAKEALVDVRARYDRQSQLLLSTDRDLLERLPAIIEQHYYGIWATQVELDYEDRYQEQLPTNWCAQLDTLPNISVEPTLDNKCVLKYCAVNEKHKNSSSFATTSTTATLSQGPASDISVACNTVHLTDNELAIEVTYAASTVEVWCRQLDTAEAQRYEQLCEHMAAVYGAAGGGEHATAVNVGGFYVVKHDECWFRVRVIHVENKVCGVTCFLIDFGDELRVSRCDVYVLGREFAREAAQAFVSRLAGLEELVNLSCAAARLDGICGRRFFARWQQDSAVDASADPVPAAPIVIFDDQQQQQQQATSADQQQQQQQPINVNQQLLQQITADSVRSLSSTTGDTVTSVYCTHAEDTGDLYVQLQSEGYDKLTSLMESYESIDFAADQDLHVEQITESDVAAGTLYLKRWAKDGRYYRCVVNDLSPGRDYAQLYFCDYGGSEIVRLSAGGSSSELFLLAKISDVLCAFPPLATRVAVNTSGKLLGADFAERALAMMPADKPVLLRIVGETLSKDGNAVPVCDLFRRSEKPGGGLFSVSASLTWDGDSNNNLDEARDAAAPPGGATVAAAGDGTDHMSRLTQKLQRLKNVAALADETCAAPVPSTGELPTPELPGPDSYLDVRVPFAVSPWNFFVQPYRTASELSRLMERLQSRYADSTAQANRPVDMTHVQPGKIYASRHEDGIWYRTSVIKVIHPGSISVFYCDFGYYANLTVKQLVPLDAEFLELPYQAIKARLAGVKPKFDKWSMQDCKYFERLVRDRTFVSVLVDCQRDELYKCDVVLNLRLYDTSTKEDIQIDRLLIAEGVASEELKVA